MNFLPARWDGGGLSVAGHALGASPQAAALSSDGEFTLGVRPEYVQLAHAGRSPARCRRSVVQAQDIGTYWLVTATSRRAVIARAAEPRSETRAGGRRARVWLRRASARTPASTQATRS